MSLKEYDRKRHFHKTPEPKGRRGKPAGGLRFVIQHHRASHDHFDLRLEMGGVYKSWAIPKGPTLNPSLQRLAVYVEDHPLDYGRFEGVIPAGNYGAGTVMLWDRGYYEERSVWEKGKTREGERRMLKGLEEGKIAFVLKGKRMQGEFALVRLGKDPKHWLLIKKHDAWVSYKALEDDTSVVTGRSMDTIAQEATERGEVWNTRKVEAVLQEDLNPEAALEPLRVQAKAFQVEVEGCTRKRAVTEGFPRKPKPMIARVTASTFEHPQYTYEVWPGGLRCLALVQGSRVELLSKAGLSLRGKGPKVVSALRGLPNCVLDGELKGGKLTVFDMLHLEGRNLRVLPLKERLKRLEGLALEERGVGVVVGHEEPPQAPHVVARDLTSTYTSGVSKHWLAFKDQAPEKARITHPDKVWFPDGTTKAVVLHYYESIASHILKHLSSRPLSLNRHPNGINGGGFFQKDWQGHQPQFLKSVPIRSGGEKTIQYLLCQNLESLRFLVNLGCIEFNPWLSHVDHLDRPDKCVIDLDPGGRPFKDVVKAALLVHEILGDIPNHVKTSGGGGMHVCVPLQGQYTFEESREFALAVCEEAHSRSNSWTSLERSPSKRRGKLYYDCFQNGRSQTLASVYCVRPRPGVKVSTPLHWDEVTPKLDPGQFTIHSVPKRVEEVGDLWEPMLKEQADLSGFLK